MYQYSINTFDSLVITSTGRQELKSKDQRMVELLNLYAVYQIVSLICYTVSIRGNSFPQTPAKKTRYEHHTGVKSTSSTPL